MQFYNNPEDSDVTIVHKDGNIFAHKVLLKIGSPGLARMLRASMKEKEQSKIELLNYLPNTVITAIKWIYGDTVSYVAPETEEEFTELIEFSDLYELVSLKRKIAPDLVKSKLPPLTIFSMIFTYHLEVAYDFAAKMLAKTPKLVEKLDLEDYKQVRGYYKSHMGISQNSNSEYHILFGLDCTWCDANDKNQIHEFLATYPYIPLVGKSVALSYKCISESPLLKLLIGQIMSDHR